MSMQEEGWFEKPQIRREGKKKVFIPIEEISEEDIHPDYFQSPRTPEQELIDKQEQTQELHTLVDHSLTAEEQKLIAKAETDVSKTVEEDYPWLKKEEDA